MVDGRISADGTVRDKSSAAAGSVNVTAKTLSGNGFIQAQNVRNSRLHRLMEQLQIRGRNLTAAEQRYAENWLEMGFSEDAIALAYERTCLNTGALNWAYMNKILQRWHEQGLHTAADVQSGDRKSVPKGASGELGAAELEAIQRVLREG